MRALLFLCWIVCVSAYYPTKVNHALAKTFDLGDAGIQRQIQIRGQTYTCDVFGPTTGNLVKIGRSYAKTGAEVPYSTSQNAYLQMIFNYINNVTDGIVIGGVRRYIQQTVCNDASDCEVLGIMYQLMAPDVDAFIGPISDVCEAASIVAEQYQIPMVNAGNYNTRFDYPNGLNWTFTINTNPFNLAKGCIDQLANAGALTAVVGATEILQAAFGTSTNFTVGTEKNPIKILDYVVLDQTELDNNQTSGPYMAPILARWQAMKPDIFIGGGGDTPGTINILEAMRDNFFDVKGQYHWIGPNIAETRAQLSWTGYGVTTGSGFDASTFNFSDPILGNSQVYVSLFHQTFNAEASYFDASNVAAPIVMLRSMQHAGSLDKNLVRQALLNFNESTILGPMTMGPDGYLENVPNYCFQILDDGSYHALYDPAQLNLANSVNLTYPFAAAYPPGFVDAHTPKSWITLNGHWFYPVVIIVPLALIAAVIVVILISRNYHILFFKKDKKLDVDGSWDT